MSESNVDYNFLGRSGLKVSNVALGALTFGKDTAFWASKIPTQTDDELAYQIMDRYVELGGNVLDTANVYGYGKSEEIVGNWLSKRERDRIVLATKVRFQMDPTNVNKIGLSRRHIVESCEESLKRLKTHYIDLYQSHCWDSATPIEETLRTFDDLIRCGKIRYFGVSNVCGWQLQKIVDRLDKMGLNNVISLQQQYNLVARQPSTRNLWFVETKVLVSYHGVHSKGSSQINRLQEQLLYTYRCNTIRRILLAIGLLTGKFERDIKPDETESRIGFVTSREQLVNVAMPSLNTYTTDDRFWNLMSVLKKIAKNHDKSVPQVAIRWLIQQDVVSSVIIGATSLKQLEDNMGAGKGWELTLDEMKELSDTSPKINYYPHEMIWGVNKTRKNLFC